MGRAKMSCCNLYHRKGKKPPLYITPYCISSRNQCFNSISKLKEKVKLYPSTASSFYSRGKYFFGSTTPLKHFEKQVFIQREQIEKILRSVGKSYKNVSFYKIKLNLVTLRHFKLSEWLDFNSYFLSKCSISV